MELKKVAADLLAAAQVLDEAASAMAKIGDLTERIKALDENFVKKDRELADLYKRGEVLQAEVERTEGRLENAKSAFEALRKKLI